METSFTSPEQLEFEEKMQAAHQLVNDILDIEEAQTTNAPNFLSERNSFRQSLINQGINPKKYAAWHIIIGSTVSFEDSIPFDLEGDNSIITHFEKYLEKLKNPLK